MHQNCQKLNSHLLISTSLVSDFKASMRNVCSRKRTFITECRGFIITIESCHGKEAKRCHQHWFLWISTPICFRNRWLPLFYQCINRLFPTFKRSVKTWELILFIASEFSKTEKNQQKSIRFIFLDCQCHGPPENQLDFFLQGFKEEIHTSKRAFELINVGRCPFHWNNILPSKLKVVISRDFCTFSNLTFSKINSMASWFFYLSLKWKFILLKCIQQYSLGLC